MNYKHNNYKAFTIIELLVAVVIIGVLALITIVSYSGIVNRVQTVSLDMELANNAKKLKIYASTTGSYPLTLDANRCAQTPVADTATCVTSSSGNTVSKYTSTASTFGLSIYSGTTIRKITESTNPYTVTGFQINLTAGSNGSVLGSGVFENGVSTIIQAIPNTGYQFSSWTGSGCPGNAVSNITVSANLSCTANFSVSVVGPARPSSCTFTHNGGTKQSTASWSSSAGATSYTLTYNDLTYSGAGTFSYTVAGSPAGEVLTNGWWNYSVYATNAGGNSSSCTSNTIFSTWNGL
jgi:prepilin-type N-terminal cleavage/methylation domain-containing protein